MKKQYWSPDELELLRKNINRSQKNMLKLFPYRTKWSVMGVKWRITGDNLSTAGTKGFRRIRNEGGDGTPPYVLEILDSCTYSHACNVRDRGYL